MYRGPYKRNALTNPSSTPILLAGGAAMYVLAQWENQTRYLNRQARARVRAALTAFVFLLVLRRTAARRRNMLNTDPEETFDYSNNPWTGEVWTLGVLDRVMEAVGIPEGLF